MKSHVLRLKVQKRDLKHLHEIDEAIAEIKTLPGRDEAIHAIMRGNFHGWDLVPAVLKLAEPESIAALYVATLGFNKRNAIELLRFLDEKRVGSVVFLCSHYFAKSCPDEFEILRAGLSDRNQPIAAVRTHAKILAMRLSGGRCIVVESSANLRSCHNIEQFCMTESPVLFDFHRTWIDEASKQWAGKRNQP